MLNRVEVANLNLNPVTKSKLLKEIAERIDSNQKTFLTTLYSEFLYHSLKDQNIRDLLNKADLAIADGIGILWADYFLSKSFTVKHFYLKIIQAWWQVVYTGAAILLSPSKLFQVFPEKIVGADLFWDLAQLAEQKKFSVFLIGWPDQQTEQVKAVLETKYLSINIVGSINTEIQDNSAIDEINKVQPDILMVAFGRIKQEKWIVKHLQNLKVKFVVGLGGSFDYAIGKEVPPPKFIRAIGLEWFYRLFTQPRRIKRIYQAVAGLVISMIRFKVYESMPFRENVVAVVVNSQDQVLLGLKKSGFEEDGSGLFIPEGYWQFPQGGVELNESAEQTAKRELSEETGLTAVKLIGQANYVNEYKWNNGSRSILNWKVYRNKGQKQFTCFFKLVSDQEVNLDYDELIKYQWVNIDQVLEKTIDFKKYHYRQILKDLKDLLEKSA